MFNYCFCHGQNAYFSHFSAIFHHVSHFFTAAALRFAWPPETLCSKLLTAASLAPLRSSLGCTALQTSTGVVCSVQRKRTPSRHTLPFLGTACEVSDVDIKYIYTHIASIIVGILERISYNICVLYCFVHSNIYMYIYMIIYAHI